MTEVIDSGFNIEARLRSLATNVVQESKVAHGRGADPFTDDDALRIDTIYQLLHVHKKIEPEYEHFPLVSENQPKSSATLLKISDLLADIPDDETVVVPETPAVAVTLPKAAQSKK